MAVLILLLFKMVDANLSKFFSQASLSRIFFTCFCNCSLKNKALPSQKVEFMWPNFSSKSSL